MTTTQKIADSVSVLDAADRLGLPLRGVISLAFGGSLEPTASGGVSARSLAKVLRDRERAAEAQAAKVGR